MLGTILLAVEVQCLVKLKTAYGCCSCSASGAEITGYSMRGA